jgi:hypothetical protein
MFRKEIKIVLVLIVALLLFMYVIPKVFAESIRPPGQPDPNATPNSGTAYRQVYCASLQSIVPTLRERGEIAVWRGVMYNPNDSDNPLNGLHELWLWVNPESGTWSVIEIHKMLDESVIGCVYAFGLLPSHMEQPEPTNEAPQSPVINKMQ